MNIEELAQTFVTLAGKPTLSKAEHEEARELMRQLKKSGMTNEEISELSKGKWTTSTVKFYTPGIKPAQPSSWQNAASLLDSLISADMTLDDVETAVNLHADLKSSGVSIDQMVNLVCAADSASIDLINLIKQYEEFKKLGISPGNAAEALSLKKELEEMGLGLGSLAPVIELAKKHGGPQQMIQALSKFESLGELTEQVDSTRNELESLNQQVVESETKLNQLLKPIEAYQKAVKLGFTEQELEKLSGLAEKYGGIKEVLEAVEAYTSHADISNKTTKAKTELDELRSKISKLETQYAHLKTATTMCDSLIQQYKFGLDAISTMFSVAKKYGEPLDVLKSIEVYGKLQALQQELGKLKGNVAECKELLAQLEGKNQEALNHMDSLNARAMAAGAEVTKVEYKLQESEALHKLFNLINDPSSAGYNEYGPLVVAMVKALLQWVSTHENNFPYPHSMKLALLNLLKELGGD
jgi:phage shock protein A